MRHDPQDFFTFEDKSSSVTIYSGVRLESSMTVRMVLVTSYHKQQTQQYSGGYRLCGAYVQSTLSCRNY